MITKERHQCEYCGSWYDKEESAKNCEMSHVKIKSVVNASYTVSGKYPRVIGVRFEDGTFCYYGKQ